MRAAKSHLDLRDSLEQQPQQPQQPQQQTASTDHSRKIPPTTTSAAGNKPPEQPPTTSPAKKHFGERPWIELEKLWGSRLKNPPPDLTEDFLTTNSSSKNQNAKAQTLPVNSRPPPHHGKKSSVSEKWPQPQSQPKVLPRRTVSNACSG